MKSDGAGGWVEEEVPFTALYNALCQLTSFTANGASMTFTNGVQSYSNRLTNAAGDITSLLGKTLAYDTAGRLSQATGVPPRPGGVNCSGLQTTTSRYNGWGQRFLRENDLEQSVFSYGLEGFTLLSQTTRRLATAQQSTTEHIWLPTASGPMPVAAVIDGVHYAVHADHLNTPRKLSDSTGQTRWQWPYSGFGEIAPQATPATGQAPVSFALRYPGQIDDGNELFYNWHRFYEPRVGRYTKADPIGLEGGWNRFGYVGGNPISQTDPTGLIVSVCEDPAFGLTEHVSHYWIKTDTKAAGMGRNHSSRIPLSAKILNHGGRHKKKDAVCTPRPELDEDCVNRYIDATMNEEFGYWVPPVNYCKTYVGWIITMCPKK